MNHPIQCAALATGMLSLAACGDATSTLVALGLADPVSATPERVVVLCDASPGSSCSEENLAALLDAALAHLAERPGSTISLYGMGETVAATALLGRAEVTVPSGLRPREEAAHREAESVRLRASLLKAAEPYLADHPRRASPILDSVGKIAALEPGADRVILITDALEESRLGRWECGPLPDSAELARSLEEERLLQPGSLTVTVTFAFRTLEAIDRGRCPLSLARAEQVAGRWREALLNAGAADVSFTGRAPEFPEVAARTAEDRP